MKMILMLPRLLVVGQQIQTTEGTEKFFGFKLHMVANCQGIPVTIQILPGALHDLTPMFEITTA